MSWSRTLKTRQILRAQIEAGEEIALLFSDLRGFSTYAAREGDRAAYRMTRVHDDVLRERINEYGIVVKTLGDGIMAAFEDAGRAVQAAVSIQAAIRERNQELADESIDVGIGVSSGTPVMSDTDFIGHSVNLAQRLSALAKGGQILVTKTVHDNVSLPPDLRYMPLGERSLKGIGAEWIAEVAWMKEVARVSDAKDRLTLILTERGTLVVEVAKDAKQELRDVLTLLQRARAEDEGALRALLQRALGRFALWVLRPPLDTRGIPRELPVDRVRLTLRRGSLFLRTGDRHVVLPGVQRDEALDLLGKAEKARASGERKLDSA